MCRLKSGGVLRPRASWVEARASPGDRYGHARAFALAANRRIVGLIAIPAGMVGVVVTQTTVVTGEMVHVGVRVRAVVLARARGVQRLLLGRRLAFALRPGRHAVIAVFSYEESVINVRRPTNWKG